VIDRQTQSLLQAILGREMRTLLLYTGDSYPWAPTEEESVLARLRQLVVTERASVISLGRYLVRRHVEPASPGSYPSAFTSWNFIAVDALLPHLLRAQEDDVALLAKDLPAVTDAEAKVEVEKLLKTKKSTLESLRILHTDAQAIARGA
jgi:hypothetical protein